MSFTDQIHNLHNIHNLGLVTSDVQHWFFSSQYLEEHTTKAKSLIDDEDIEITFDMPDEHAAMRYAWVKQNFIEVGEDQTERLPEEVGVT